MTEAVLDAGPLIHLAELDALDTLIDLEVLYVAEAVWHEVAAYQPQALEFPGIRLQRIAPLPPSAELQTLALALALDRGEIESLGLMETRPRAWFLTDDAAARLAAEQRGYQVHGTIGMLIRSVRRGQRKPAEVLNLLRTLSERSTLHVRPGLLQTIIQRLEREWNRRT
jgi:predicted nucleic acid-binding protein